MASDSCVSYYETERGFPELLRDTMRYLRFQGYLEYYRQAYPEREGQKWMVTLYIRDSPALVGWNTTAVSHEFLEACHISVCDAIKKICSTYHGVVQHSPMRFLLPMNKLTPAWHKRTTILA